MDQVLQHLAADCRKSFAGGYVNNCATSMDHPHFAMGEKR